MDVGPSIREFARKQAAKFNKLGKHVIGGRIFLETVSKKHNDPKANTVTYEVDIPGKNVIVQARAANLYDAITAATNSATRQVRKVLEKRRTKARREE